MENQTNLEDKIFTFVITVASFKGRNGIKLKIIHL